MAKHRSMFFLVMCLSATGLIFAVPAWMPHGHPVGTLFHLIVLTLLTGTCFAAMMLTLKPERHTPPSKVHPALVSQAIANTLKRCDKTPRDAAVVYCETHSTYLCGLCIQQHLHPDCGLRNLLPPGRFQPGTVPPRNIASTIAPLHSSKKPREEESDAARRKNITPKW